MRRVPPSSPLGIKRKAPLQHNQSSSLGMYQRRRTRMIRRRRRGRGRGRGKRGRGERGRGGRGGRGRGERGTGRKRRRESRRKGRQTMQTLSRICTSACLTVPAGNHLWISGFGARTQKSCNSEPANNTFHSQIAHRTMTNQSSKSKSPKSKVVIREDKTH